MRHTVSFIYKCLSAYFGLPLLVFVKFIELFEHKREDRNYKIRIGNGDRFTGGEFGFCAKKGPDGKVVSVVRILFRGVIF